MKSLVGSSRNGLIVGEDGKQNLFLFDPENGGVLRFAEDVNIEDRFAVFNYNETLVSLKGEMQITMSLNEKRIMDLRDSTGLYAKIMSESDGNCYLVLPLEDGSLVGIGIAKSVFDN